MSVVCTGRKAVPMCIIVSLVYCPVFRISDSVRHSVSTVSRRRHAGSYKAT